MRTVQTSIAALVLLVPSLGWSQTSEFGNVSVVQNDANNNATSVTLTAASGSSPGFSIRGGNRGDYDVSFGTFNDPANGVMVSCVSENGRDNSAAGDAFGLFHGTSAADFNAAGYYIPVFRCANGDEANINVACGWFSYSHWLGGLARNATGTNGGANNTLTASPGINLGTQFIDNGGGLSTVDLTSLGGSSASGILLVTHAKNEDNYAMSRANGDGTFTLYVHDNGSNGTGTEQDPVAFVYIPASAVGTQQLVAMGRVNSNATTDLSGGTFTLTKGPTGQWYLSIPGENNTTGVLLISPEGGGTNTSDNVVSYQWDDANSRWIIESRDLSGSTNQPTLQNGATDGEDVFSFAFFANDNLPPESNIASPVESSFFAPATFTVEATATDPDGSIDRVEFLRNGVVIGTDTEGPYTLTQTGLPAGSYTYIARAIDDSGAAGLSAPKQVTVTFDPDHIPANTALFFDGTDDYVTMGPAPELNVGGPVGNGLTLECWFRKEGTGLTSSSGSGGVSAVPLFGKGRGESDGSNVDCNIFFGITTGGILVADFESQQSGLNHPITATNAPIANGVWYHAAVTFDGATGIWKMYLNGVEVGAASVSEAGSMPRYDSIQHFGIGTAMNSAGVREGAFAGVIDEARVWNFARSAGDIAAAKDLELASGAGLIGRFGFNEGVGDMTTNSVGPAVGTLTNGPVWVEGAPFATANLSPIIALEEPDDNDTAVMPFDVTFEATASDADGSVARVDFFVDDVLVASDTSAPYSHAWTPPGPGFFEVHARAEDNLGARTLTPAATLEVVPNPNQPPVVTLTSPAEDAVAGAPSVTLEASLADPEGDAMTVTFYGRLTTPATPGPDFSIVAIPDTQYYSQGSSGRANTVTVDELIATFGHQTQWVVDNRMARNIAFVAHMGDIVESGNNGGNPVEWERASAAMGNLENPIAAMRAHGIPYGIAPGNHDIDPIGAYDTGSTAFYNQYFPVSRFSSRDYYGGHYGSDYTNSYQLFSASGLDFISIHFAYDTTPNQAILDWADALLKAHPHRRAIVTSHWIIGGGNPASFSAQGSAIYQNLKDNPNLFLMLCGHIHAEGRRADVFEGRTVYSVLSDYQFAQNGGNGLLRIFTFSPANNTISAESWSPTVNREANAGDGLEYFDGPFTVPYDMQSPLMDWVEIGTVNVPASGTTASINWNGLEAGKNYEWYAAASDGLNAAASTSRRFSTASAMPPTVTLDTPLDGATFASPAMVPLSATAADADGSVFRVDFYEGGTKIGEDTSTPFEFTWSGVQPGSYTLSAIAVDDSGLSAFSNAANITVTLGDNPPTVALTAPLNGTVLEAPANVTLLADAADLEGTVAKVEFFSGATTPVSLGEDTTSPFTLDLTNLGAGSYTFTAVATDSVDQTTTSAPVTISVFTEAPAPNVANVSVATIDPPAWTIVQTSPAPLQFDSPGTNAGDVELHINGASTPFLGGVVLATNWTGPASTGGLSLDNLCQPYNDGFGNAWVSVFDNSNNNASNANPSTSEQTAGVSVAFLPYADGFTGASVNSSASILAGNLPAGVTVVPAGTGTYAISGLSTAGNLIAVTNGNSGTLADNICSVRVASGRWLVQTRDNGNFNQSNEFTFVYLPPETQGLFAGKIAADGTVSDTNAAATAMGVTATLDSAGMNLTIGDGTVINPSNAALFYLGDSTNGGDASPAADNLTSWTADGNSFRLFTQDLPEINGTFEAIDVRFLVMPYTALPEQALVTIAATDAAAGEYGADQTLEFTVTRDTVTANALDVHLLSQGSAAQGVDYTGLVSPVTIPANQASASLTLTVSADNEAEGTESVELIVAADAIGNDYAPGTPDSASASIADRPDQNWYFQNIPDPARRGRAQNGDDDIHANIVEYFMGTLPGDGSSVALTPVTTPGDGSNAVFCFQRALNRDDVTGVVEWSTNLTHWHRSGDSNGTITVSITESTDSLPTDDPQIIKATATNPAGDLPEQIFFRLRVSE